MKATVTLPFFIKSSSDERDDFDVQIDLLTSLLEFDEQQISELKKDKRGAVLDVLYMGNGYTLVYSPLFFGAQKANSDFAVSAYFDEMQRNYDLNPEEYFNATQMRVFKQNNSLPEHLPWEVMKQCVSPLMQSAQIEQQFDTWLAGKQKDMLLSEVGEGGTSPLARKI